MDCSETEEKFSVADAASCPNRNSNGAQVSTLVLQPGFKVQRSLPQLVFKIYQIN